MDGETTPSETPRERQLANLKPAWQPGQSGNPAGRPKGSRHKLSEDFFRELAKAFEERGATAIAAMIEDSPKDFVKTIASLQSKELTGKDGEDLIPPSAVIWKRATDV